MSFAALSQPASAQDVSGCKSNDDCKGGRVCVSGACTNPTVNRVTTAPPEPARATLGERCSARSDCSAELRCLRNVCVDEATLEASRPEATVTGTRGYVGFALGTSLPAVWSSWGESFQLALRVGAIFDGPKRTAHERDHIQLQLEVSPAATLLTNIQPSAVGLFDVVGTVAYMVTISDIVSWIFRGGVGGGGIFGSTADAARGLPAQGFLSGFAEFRLDVVSVAIRPSKHVMVELNVPSFRITTTTAPANEFGESAVIWMWVTNAAFNYVF